MSSDILMTKNAKSGLVLPACSLVRRSLRPAAQLAERSGPFPGKWPFLYALAVRRARERNSCAIDLCAVRRYLAQF